MTPLDLSRQPPRPPSAELGGIVFLARSVDKVRATLPGGSLGAYQLPGWTERLLAALGIDLRDLTAAVAAAHSEDDVAAFVREHTTPAKIAAWNADAIARQPRDGNRVAAREIFPWIDERPDLITTLELLEEDDRRLFGAA